jgi:hypothetical protein
MYRLNGSTRASVSAIEHFETNLCNGYLNQPCPFLPLDSCRLLTTCMFISFDRLRTIVCTPHVQMFARAVVCIAVAPTLMLPTLTQDSAVGQSYHDFAAIPLRLSQIGLLWIQSRHI